GAGGAVLPRGGVRLLDGGPDQAGEVAGAGVVHAGAGVGRLRAAERGPDHRPAAAADHDGAGAAAAPDAGGGGGWGRLAGRGGADAAELPGAPAAAAGRAARSGGGGVAVARPRTSVDGRASDAVMGEGEGVRDEGEMVVHCSISRPPARGAGWAFLPG